VKFHFFSSTLLATLLRVWDNGLALNINFYPALFADKWEKKMYVLVEGSGKAVENWKLT
jgi:hypothetical protein